MKIQISFWLMIGVGLFLQTALAQDQPAPARPHFEVAALKLNPGCENMARKWWSFTPSPDRLEMPCVNLKSLIQTAYGTFGDGVTINTQPLHMEGGPSWMQTEFYDVSAKADAPPARPEMMAGPMLQALLEERFHLKTHREARVVPVYAMTVGKGGLKAQQLAEGACTPIDLVHPAPPPSKPGDPTPIPCGVMLIRQTETGDMRIEVHGATMEQLAQRLSGRVGRTVVDKTGIAGRFNFHLEFAPAPSMSAQGPASAPGGDSGNASSAAIPAPPAEHSPNIFVALQEQIGLKLSSEEGSVTFLIIDHVEKPTAN